MHVRGNMSIENRTSQGLYDKDKDKDQIHKDKDKD